MKAIKYPRLGRSANLSFAGALGIIVGYVLMVFAILALGGLAKGWLNLPSWTGIVVVVVALIAACYFGNYCMPQSWMELVFLILVSAVFWFTTRWILKEQVHVGTGMIFLSMLALLQWKKFRGRTPTASRRYSTQIP